MGIKITPPDSVGEDFIKAAGLSFDSDPHVSSQQEPPSEAASVSPSIDESATVDLPENTGEIVAGEEPSSPALSAKEYRSLQSAMDKKIAGLERKMQEQISSALTDIKSMLSSSNKPPIQQETNAPEYGYEDPEQAQAQQYLKNVIKETVQKDLGYDPKVQEQVAWQQANIHFLSNNPEASQFYPLMAETLRMNPQIPLNEAGLKQVYDFWKNLNEKVASQAVDKQAVSNAGESAKQNVASPPAGKITPEQAEQLRRNAATLPQNNGLTGDRPGEPKIDMSNMRRALEQMVNLAAEKMPFSS